MRDTIKEIVAQISGSAGNPTELTDATRLSEDLGLDSLRLMSVLLKIEAELGVDADLSEVTADSLATIGSLAAFFEGQLSKT